MKDCCAPGETPKMAIPVAEKTGSKLKTYFPLLLILGYLLLGILLLDWKNGGINPMQAMTHFMGGFFLIFSFFKFLNLQGFADAYQTYDVVAKRSRSYAYAYPFVELLLGIAYFTAFMPFFIHSVTLIVMLVSSIGVIQSLREKRKIECACLGTVFKLPMTQVTLFEDLIMAAMAFIGLMGNG